MSAKLIPVLQEGGADCGCACLAAVLAFHSPGADGYVIKRSLVQSNRGTTFAHLAALARANGLLARGLQCRAEGLRQVALPAIAHWTSDHFVVVESVSGETVTYMDPRTGRVCSPIQEFAAHFGGTILELVRSPTFQPLAPTRTPSLLALIGTLQDAPRRFAAIFAVGLTIEVCTVVYPVILQTAIDTVVPSNDWGMLAVLVGALVCLTGLQAAFSFSRGILTTRLAAFSSFQLSASAFWAMIQSPPAYFTARSSGEMLAKFSSIDAIRNVVAMTTVALALDLLFLVLALSLLAAYSPLIAALSCGTIAFFTALRFWIQSVINREAFQAISASARQSSFLLESIQAIATIRLLGMEDRRQSGHQQRVTSVLGHEVQIGRQQALSGAAQNLIFGLDNIVFLAICVHMLSVGSLSLGSMFAALAFKAMLGSRVASAVEKAMQFNGLGIHLRRLEDLPSPANIAHERALPDGAGRQGMAIRLEDVSFRYSPDEPWVVEDFSLSLAPGEHVCLVAPSGAGKSTVLGIVAGLNLSASGKVLVDGQPLGREVSRSYWSQVAVVRQDDVLFDGTILDNVSAFDETADETRGMEALAFAALAQEVLALPLGLHTRIGPHGEGLSGGQKQRLMLARAFFRRPRLLILDEATSHLDEDNEAIIVANVRRLGCTVLMAAHRAETVRSADRIVRLGTSTDLEPLVVPEPAAVPP